MFTEKVSGKSKSTTLKTAIALLAVLFLVIPGTGLLSIDLSQASGGDWYDDHDNHWKGPRFCSRTATAAFRAGQNEVEDDYWIAVGNCYNLSEADDRAECLEDAKAEYKEGKELTKDQREARLEICDNLGEAPYDPDLDPGDFINFDDVIDGDSFTPNRYFPLVPGTKWVYDAYDEEGDLAEHITVEVTNDTKEIEYPADSGKIFTCIVVSDVVTDADSSEVIEDTKDWYAQDNDGNVWYMGEIAQNFEDGDLVDIEGSWKAGRDGAKPGYLMLAAPEVGDVYRQEVSWGDAEDVAEVTSTTGSESVPAASCTGDCLVTRDFTAIEPGINESKYYALGVGLILEVDNEGNRVELVEMTTP
jgi:hypothetical protein